MLVGEPGDCVIAIQAQIFLRQERYNHVGKLLREVVDDPATGNVTQQIPSLIQTKVSWLIVEDVGEKEMAYVVLLLLLFRVLALVHGRSSTT